jgi:hypothetical protein
MSTVAELLEQLDGFADHIAAAIEFKDWDSLNELLPRRQELLEQLCASPMSDQERAVANAMMASIQLTDQQFMAMVQDQKDALQKQATLLAHDRKAIQAYQSE